MTPTSSTLRQITKAYQLIRCEKLLHAAQALITHYRCLCRIKTPVEQDLEPEYIGEQIDTLEEQIQLIQYQLFTLGWTDKPQATRVTSRKRDQGSVAYALCLSRIISQEKYLQQAVNECLSMALSAGYNILELQLRRILESSQQRMESLLNAHESHAA